MNPEKLYSYVVLKFTPDAVTGEALNAGIVFYCPADNLLIAKMRTSIVRLTQAFPGVSGNGLKRILGWIQTSVNKHASRISKRSKSLFEDEPRSALEFATLHYPIDDSLLQWSPERRGFTFDAKKEAERVFARTISNYDRPHEKATRSDADVWFKYLKYLESFGVSTHLMEHTVEGDIEPYVFEHALKNGRWHCLEPMSFDLMKPESIKAKAREKFAAMSFLKELNSDLKVYFLLGEPSSDEGQDATETAIRILARSPIDSEVVREAAAPFLAEKLVEMTH